MFKRLSIYITFVLTLSNCMDFAIAQTTAGAIESPVNIVRQLYRPYVTDLPPPDSLSLIAHVATPHLKLLILRDEACQAQTQGICRIDFDPIVAAQDFDFREKYPEFQEQKTRSGSLVTAKFRFANDAFYPEASVYYDFIFDGRRWLINDIRGKMSPESYDLVKILSEKF